jgi:hypothetical protein
VTLADGAVVPVHLLHVPSLAVGRSATRVHAMPRTDRYPREDVRPVQPVHRIDDMDGPNGWYVHGVQQAGERGGGG